MTETTKTPVSNSEPDSSGWVIVYLLGALGLVTVACLLIGLVLIAANAG